MTCFGLCKVTEHFRNLTIMVKILRKVLPFI